MGMNRRLFLGAAAATTATLAVPQAFAAEAPRISPTGAFTHEYLPSAAAQKFGFKALTETIVISPDTNKVNYHAVTEIDPQRPLDTNVTIRGVDSAGTEFHIEYNPNGALVRYRSFVKGKKGYIEKIDRTELFNPPTNEAEALANARITGFVRLATINRNKIAAKLLMKGTTATDQPQFVVVGNPPKVNQSSPEWRYQYEYDHTAMVKAYLPGGQEADFKVNPAKMIGVMEDGTQVEVIGNFTEAAAFRATRVAVTSFSGNQRQDIVWENNKLRIVRDGTDITSHNPNVGTVVQFYVDLAAQVRAAVKQRGVLENKYDPITNVTDAQYGNPSLPAKPQLNMTARPAPAPESAASKSPPMPMEPIQRGLQQNPKQFRI